MAAFKDGIIRRPRGAVRFSRGSDFISIGMLVYGWVRCAHVSALRWRRNENRLLSLMSPLRVNAGTSGGPVVEIKDCSTTTIPTTPPAIFSIAADNRGSIH